MRCLRVDVTVSSLAGDTDLDPAPVLLGVLVRAIIPCPLQIHSLKNQAPTPPLLLSFILTGSCSNDPEKLHRCLQRGRITQRPVLLDGSSAVK